MCVCVCVCVCVHVLFWLSASCLDICYKAVYSVLCIYFRMQNMSDCVSSNLNYTKVMLSSLGVSLIDTFFFFFFF